MMRSRSNSSRSLSEMVRDNPFLCAAFFAGVSLAALESEIGSPAILHTMWMVLGFGFHLAADWPRRLMPGMTGWLSAAMAIVLGLIPYLLADVLWRKIRNR